MNKRVKLKTQKKQNLARHKEILTALGEHFKVKNKIFYDGYFLCDFGKSSVCHFTLKDTPEWSYGIWLLGDSFEIFGEHDDFIDKFKPTRTHLAYKDDIEEFITTVSDIAARPDYHLADILSGGTVAFPCKKIGESIRGYQVVHTRDPKTNEWISTWDESITQEEFIAREIAEHRAEEKEKAEEIEAVRKSNFAFFKRLLDFDSSIRQVIVSDRMVLNPGLIISPRYDLLIVVEDDVTEDECSRLSRVLDNHISNASHEASYIRYEHSFDFRAVYWEREVNRSLKQKGHYFFRKETA